MKTLIVNIFGGPGAGKSTTMAGVFSALKRKDIDCEQVTEFAKDLVWEDRQETFKDEIYIFAKQAHRLFRVNGKVRVVVTDRPLILTNLYATDKKLCDLCLSEFGKYNNLNFLVHRTKKYNPNGRNQTEAEALSLDNSTKQLLDTNNIDYKIVEYAEAVDIITSEIVELLQAAE